MNEIGEQPQTRSQKLGWGILLVISALMVLNGVTWFVVGPDMSLSYTAQVAGVPVEEFTQLYPGVVEHLARNTRQVAIWFAGFGLMALIVALEGFRNGSRWAWIATWVVVGVPIAIGINYLSGGELGFDNVGMFFFGAVALVGQLLARKR